MTNRELIAKLSELSLDAEVYFVYDNTGDCYELQSVDLDTDGAIVICGGDA